MTTSSLERPVVWLAGRFMVGLTSGGRTSCALGAKWRSGRDDELEV